MSGSDLAKQRARDRLAKADARRERTAGRCSRFAVFFSATEVLAAVALTVYTYAWPSGPLVTFDGGRRFDFGADTVDLAATTVLRSLVLLFCAHQWYCRTSVDDADDDSRKVVHESGYEQMFYPPAGAWPRRGVKKARRMVMAATFVQLAFTTAKCITRLVAFQPHPPPALPLSNSTTTTTAAASPGPLGPGPGPNGTATTEQAHQHGQTLGPPSTLFFWATVGVCAAGATFQCYAVVCLLSAWEKSLPRTKKKDKKKKKKTTTTKEGKNGKKRKETSKAVALGGAMSLNGGALLAAPLLDPTTEWHSNDNDESSSESTSSSDDDDSEDDDAGKSAGGGHKILHGTTELGRGASLHQLWVLSRPDWPLMLCAFTSLVVAALGQALIPMWTGDIINLATANERDEAAFRRAVGWLTLSALGTAVFTALRGSIFTVTMARLNVRVRKLLFHRLLAQEIGFFDSTKTGDITSRLSADTTKLADQVSLNVNVFLRSIISALGVLGFMFHISPKLSCVTFVSIPIVVAGSKVYGAFVRKLSKRAQKELAGANTVAEETLAAMKTVRCFNAAAGEELAYEKKLLDFYDVNFLQASAYAGYAVYFTLVPNLVTCLILYYGGQLVHAREGLNQGNLVSFMLYQQSLSSSFNTIGNIWTGLSQALGAADKVFELINREPLAPPLGTYDPPAAAVFQGRITLENVTLRYPARPESVVLHGLSLDIAPGSVVALVGPSGGGKSSIIKLILNLYQPESGRVLVDGRPVHEYDPAFFRRIVSVVGQEPTLFGRSVEDNIAFGLEDEDIDGLGGTGTGRKKKKKKKKKKQSARPQWARLAHEREREAASTARRQRRRAAAAAAGALPLSTTSAVPVRLRRRIRTAAIRANAHGFISDMSKGYKTGIGERGTTVSGGQKQRMAIARALVREPAVLLLDEATSALDAESEAVVQEALDKIMSNGKGTVVVIAHRLSTVVNADRIVVIDAGRVKEQGTHAELLRQGGIYAKLVRRQMQDSSNFVKTAGGGGDDDEEEEEEKGVTVAAEMKKRDEEEEATKTSND